MHKLKFIVLIIIMGVTGFNFGQTAEQTQRYRDEPLGSKLYRKKGILDGNLVRSVFRNDGEIGDWIEAGPVIGSGEWPKGTGQSYIDGCTPIITSGVIAPGNGQLIHPVEAAYREEVDKDPVTGASWINQPVPGYVAESSETPAISTKPLTWPSIWSRALPNIDASWDGYWYGYFGRGVQNADQETFYVMDDSQDGEYTRPPYLYYPIASNTARGGLGLRIEVRGFQWSHVLAEDIIFWHYDIINISDYDYDSTYFGFYCDTGVGGFYDGGDDYASYDTKLDIAYAFDDPPVGGPASARYKTGYVGYAFLESPGNGFNGIDDDEDGIIDEKRDDGIDNNNNWLGYTDVNGNGVWDADLNEPLNNDVGKDGVGPLDILIYNGRDEGEGDGKPTDGEPNFDKTDKDESDQIGLTSLAIQRLAKGPTTIWPKNDEVVYKKMTIGSFDTSVQNANIQILFGSGPFPLKQNLRERFSVALVFGEDFDDMVFNKETVQQIYNANYNFSKPPFKPTLTAIPGDRKVSLFWDGIAEKSVDPFLGYKEDFEGYMILRSQEPEFQDIKVITDSKGSAKYSKPIAQFDLANGIKGPDPIGVNGAHFWRGDDTGLQHSFIDTNVVNGQTYYYACVAYDQGDPNYGSSGLIPSETTKTISVDAAGTVTFIDYNCAVVVPEAPAAGYESAKIEGDLKTVTEGIGTGSLKVTVLNDAQVLGGAKYKVNFISTEDPIEFKTTNYIVTREYQGALDTLKSAGADSSTFGEGILGVPFDGLALSVLNYDIISPNSTGWVRGFSNYDMRILPDTGKIAYPAQTLHYPSDYQLVFLPEKTVITPYSKIAINFIVKNITRGDTVDAEIFDLNNSKQLDIGDVIVILEKVDNKIKYAWKISYKGPANAPFAAPPVAGDILLVKTNKPFKTGDYFAFSTLASGVDKTLALQNLDNINVVPNPYVVTNIWEKRTVAESGRGDRRIDFTNLPANCTVRIYTITGALIKTLYKDSSPTVGSLTWNLVTEDGMDIAYGVYIFHIDAPGIGEKIGKFAVIK